MFIDVICNIYVEKMRGAHTHHKHIICHACMYAKLGDEENIKLNSKISRFIMFSRLISCKNLCA
jgi:Mlc titration factor MtfA (ptsG expression regulator)